MADNVTADPGTGGAIFAAAQLTFSGDTADVPLNGIGILSGSEGSWTMALQVGGAGAVASGVQRVTLASDDPAVAKLGQIFSTGIPVTGTVTVGSHDVTNVGVFAVQVSSALPAGTNAIGKLASNAGVTIGAVEIAAAQTLATVTTVGTVSSVTAIANALPAGNNNIGDVDIASIAAGDNNIGNVDIVTVPSDPLAP